MKKRLLSIEIPDFVNTIADYCEDIYYCIKRFYRRIKNFRRYIPIIWQDEQWDFDYLLELVKWKITFMKEYFEQGEITTPETYGKMINAINEALEHIEGYRDSWKVYEEKFGKCPIETEKVLVHDEDMSLARFVTISKETGKELTPEEEALYYKHVESIYKFEQEEWDKIWDVLKEHGQSMWD